MRGRRVMVGWNRGVSGIDGLAMSGQSLHDAIRTLVEFICSDTSGVVLQSVHETGLGVEQMSLDECRSAEAVGQ